MKKPKAEIKLHNGSPAIFVDGKIVPPFAFRCAQDFSEKCLDAFSGLGTGIILFDGNAELRQDDGQYDFSGLDDIIFRIVKANPRALIMPRISAIPPAWRIKSRSSGIAGDSRHRDALDFIETLVSHVESIPLSSHVIGYHILSSRDEEWFSCSSAEADPGLHSQESFRLWLREKYKDVKTLRGEWNNGQIDFESAEIPSAKEMGSPGSGEFFSPGTQRNVIDFYGYYHWKAADTIRCFAAAVKEKSKRRLLVGVSYGCQLQAVTGGQLDSGQYALKEILGSRDIDILCGPVSYAGAGSGAGYAVFASLAASVKLHRKLWLDENFVPVNAAAPEKNITGARKDIISMQYSQFGNALCSGTGVVWAGNQGRGFEDKTVSEETAKLYKCGRRSINFDLSSAAEIAIIFDEKSVFLRSPGAKFQSFDRIADMGLIGAPVDFMLLEDIPYAKPYKLYFFKYCYRTSREILKMLGKKVKTDEKWCLWLDHPGFFNEDDKTMSLENSEPLTGLRISEHGHTVQNEDADLSARLGRPAKSFDGWTSVYFKDHPQSGELRKICKEAGVHLYAETGDAMCANRSFLCIYTDTGGRKKIKLPMKADIYDVREQRQIACGVWEFDVELMPFSTSIFFIGKGDKWMR